MRHDGLRLVLVGYVDGDGLHTMEISEDGIPAARERGWMVFDDFEPAREFVNRPRISAQGDGDMGESNLD